LRCGLIVVVAVMMMLVLMPVVVMAILRHIDVLVPAVLDEIHRCAAGTVAMAVLVPVLHVPGWSVQVHGRGSISRRLRNHGLTVDQLRRRVAAHIDAAIEAGLADTDRKIVGMTAMCGKSQQ